ncbi:chaperone modulator CbpM [Hansschlegelia sp.]|uniref:chaperone modulator CbpM n=1 Tax=Hansschlegelia sp. TaxID=2041892 RepID=UPI002CC22BE8|nr:chaperone modulator CbpM [Hansschlegelia sp.]HVI29968.1 chaperone modulator CbpM [Hansschlegelia sp.]
MTIDHAEMCRRVSVGRPSLQRWIEAGWIHAPSGDGFVAFSEMDVARAHLIRDLAGPMGVNPEGVAVILDLIDQIHGLRHALRGLSMAVGAQDPEVRRRIWSDAAHPPSGPSRAAGALGGRPRAVL